MINRIIDFSVENKFIVFALAAAACLAGWWSMQHLALDAIPDLSDTQVIIYSRWDRSPDIDRGPGDLPDRLGHGGRPAGQGGPGLLRFRLLLRLRHLRGRHRHLLGPVAHPGIPFLRAAAPAAGCEDRTGAGCHGPGLGLPVRPGGRVRQAQPGRAALLPGLVPEVLPERPCRGSPRLRPSAGSASSTR